MDEFNYLQFLNYDCELLEAKEVLLAEFSIFSERYEEYFDTFLPHPPQTCGIPSPTTNRQIQSQLRKNKM